MSYANLMAVMAREEPPGKLRMHTDDLRGEIRTQADAFRHEMDEFRREMNERFDSLNRRLAGGAAVIVAAIIGSNLLG
jgi:hypothetical protein